MRAAQILLSSAHQPNDTRIMDTQPASFTRRILLAVTGLSPQVVTETVHALAEPSTRGVDDAVE